MIAQQQNSLSQLNYKFKLRKTPNVEYRVQTVTLPGLNLGSVDVPTPFVRIPQPGNLSYDDLTITFLVGEYLADYLEIYNWMISLGHPDDLAQYDKANAVSDATVHILNSAMKTSTIVRFTNIFPVALSPLEFDVTLPDVQYAVATATFRVGRFYIEPVPNS